MLTLGDKITHPQESNHVIIFISSNGDTNRLRYLGYNTETGRSLEMEAQLPPLMEGEHGEDGGGEWIRCLRESRSGRVVRRHGDLIVYQDKEGRYHLTHRLFSLPFIDTGLCNQVARGAKRPRSDAVDWDEESGRDWNHCDIISNVNS